MSERLLHRRWHQLQRYGKNNINTSKYKYKFTLYKLLISVTFAQMSMSVTCSETCVREVVSV